MVNNTKDTNRHLLLFFVYFSLSTLLTWLFVVASPLYISTEQLLLSTTVAGGKWAIQLLLALLLLGNKKFAFIHNIGFVCFIGSCILLPYILLSYWGIANGSNFFIGSLATAVLTMIVLYYRAVQKTAIPFYWWLFWLGCLAIAISLQLTVVFHVL